MKRLIVYAPNVHTGGGLVLLRALLQAQSLPPLVLFSDARAALAPVAPRGTQVFEVQPTFASRLAAEVQLRRAAEAGDLLLCFHGQPPLLSSAARVVVFVQNREYISSGPLGDYRWTTRLRLNVERRYARALRHRVAEYVVQTFSMRRLIEQWHGGSPSVRVQPFIDALPARPPRADAKWDFAFVSDGEAHKNHLRLLEAWALLAQEGLKPSLVLTLGPRDAALVAAIEERKRRSGLAVENVGLVPREEIFRVYQASRALIFPSTLESFGLPLVEASHFGLPILAPELDYVRDVCTPAETFDAASAVSIARAVKRFLGRADAPVQAASAEHFIRALMP